MTVCQCTLREKELFYFEDGSVKCGFENCSWSISKDEEEAYEKIFRHFRFEHLDLEG